jgi:DNA-binding CsgD family transcriptional regulator
VIVLVLKDIDIRNNVERLRQELKQHVEAVREELDVHLDTINQGTDEIQQNFEYLAQIESKIDKLSERIEAIELHLTGGKRPQVSKIDLSLREQEVFLIIYSTAEKLSRKHIARRLGFTEDMVEAYLANIITKGVPVLRQAVEGETLYFLDLRFREQQAKYKVIAIHDQVVRELFS